MDKTDRVYMHELTGDKPSVFKHETVKENPSPFDPYRLIPIITAIPSILAAYKTVKSLNNDKTHNEIQNHLAQTGKPSLTTKQLNSLKKPDLNRLKRQVAIDLLIPLLLAKIQRRGGNKDDIGTIVDFACLIYKIARGK